MLNKVNLNGKSITLTPKMVIGKGGEADIYDVGNNLALKVFKPSDHPDYVGNKVEQDGAKSRIAIHQTKLADFPSSLTTDRVVRPIAVAKDDKGQVVGYTMNYLKGMELITMLSQRSFRDNGYTNKMVDDLFADVHKTVKEIHKNNIVVGDFNDLNLLVDPNKPQAYFLDADSWQYGRYISSVFTQRFVDPVLCDPNATSLLLSQLHNENSDWYAYTTMLFNSLLFVMPYGGIYRPAAGTQIKHDQRPLKGISVFNKEVKYPKPATPYDVLTDDLLQFFFNTYEKQARGEFPVDLLNMEWKKCPACGLEHARSSCPRCTKVIPAVNVQQAVEIRGNVTSRTVFRTRGRIVYATYQDKLRYAYHEDGHYKREGDIKVISSPKELPVRIRIQKEQTLFAMNDAVTVLGGRDKEVFKVDSVFNIPVFDANSKGKYYSLSGSLLKAGKQFDTGFDIYADTKVGDVLSNQTLFWVGESLGFGFYRAANINVAFVFNPDKTGINDSVKLPGFTGQLVDSTCIFTKDYAWFFASLNIQGKLINKAYVIDKSGQVVATHSCDTDSNQWLAQIRGKCAVSNFILCPTDEGIVRVEIQGSSLVATKKFPDTEPFVDSACHLFAGTDGLFVVDRSEIRQLEIK